MALLSINRILSAMNKSRRSSSKEARQGRTLMDINNQLLKLGLEEQRLESQRKKLLETSGNLTKSSEKLVLLQQQLAAHLSRQQTLSPAEYERTRRENNRLNFEVQVLKALEERELGDFKDIADISARLEEIDREMAELANEARGLLSLQLQEGGTVSHYAHIASALERTQAK